MTAWEIIPSGTEGYRTTEVTASGVDTHELSSKTMESSEVSGLYFIGEAVDVTGHLGGFNFQWAWSSEASCAAALLPALKTTRQPRVTMNITALDQAKCDHHH